MDRNLVIIGAGTAGLTAGIYAAKSGFRTTILEMGNVPGGLCTSWRRKGYLFDGSAAGLAGSAPGTPIYRLWKDTGVIGHCELHDADNFGSIVFPDGRTVTIYTNIDRLESHLLEMFPAEERVIRELTGALRSSLDMEIPFVVSGGLRGFLEGVGTAVSAFRKLPLLLKYGSMPLHRFFEKVHDPSLKEVFKNLVHFGGSDVPLLTVLLPVAYSHRRMTGIPRDGWLSFARAVERRFLDSGGEIRYRSKVVRLVTEGNRVRGVELADGSRIPADIVLSAVDGRFTRTVLLGEADTETGASFDRAGVSDQPVQVCLGVNEDWSDVRGPVTYLLTTPVTAAGREQTKITVHNRYYDPAGAPEGKSALIAFLDSDYGFWKDMEGDRSRYEEEKRKCADAVMDAISGFRPGFRAKVEVVEVATPLTRERYTGNYLGAMQAWKPNSGMIGALLQGRTRYDYPGLKGFYMAGQWVEPWGGITTAAQSGRKAVRKLCRDMNMSFTAP